MDSHNLRLSKIIPTKIETGILQLLLWGRIFNGSKVVWLELGAPLAAFWPTLAAPVSWSTESTTSAGYTATASTDSTSPATATEPTS